MSTKRPLQAALHTGNIWLIVLWSMIIFFCQPSLSSSAQSPPTPHASGSPHSLPLSEGVAQQVGLTVFGWEGSAEGKAYSEFNHRLAGAVVVIIGLSELHGALGIMAWLWMRFLLPLEAI